MGKYTLEQLLNFKQTEYNKFQAYKTLDDLLIQKEHEFQGLPNASSILNREMQILADKKTLDGLQFSYAEAVRQCPLYLSKFEAGTKEVEKQEYLLEYYKAVLEDLSQSNLNTLSTLLTDVYQTVYDVQDKRVHLSMEESRGKKLVKMNILNNYEGNEYKEGFDSEGGSVKIVLGIVVSMFFILKTNSPRVLFLDETLSAFSTPVLHRFCQVLQKFSNNMGFTFIIIEHSAHRMREYIDKIYTIENGIYREVGSREWDEVFRKTRGEQL